MSCACFRAKAYHTHTINVAHLTYQNKVQLLTYLAMTRFGPRIEPITFSTHGRCATSYATDAGTLKGLPVSKILRNKQTDSHRSNLYYRYVRVESEVFLMFTLAFLLFLATLRETITLLGALYPSLTKNYQSSE